MSSIRKRRENNLDTMSGEHQAGGVEVPSKLPAPSALWMPVALGMGLVFGIAFQKSHVYEPLVIRSQFTFEKWIMMKMFLSAAGTSMLSFTLVSFLSPHFGARIDSIRRGYLGHVATVTDHGHRRHSITDVLPVEASVKLYRVLIGTGILGTGMYVGGACPGMVLSQVGTGTENFTYTLAGCFAGAFLYLLLAPVIERMPLVNKQVHLTQPFLDLKLHLPYGFAAGAMGIMLWCIALILEFAFPWENDLPENAKNEPGCSPLECKSWPPTVGGLIVGSLQLPAVLVMGSILGASTSYATIISESCSCMISDLPSSFNSPLSGHAKWWQPMYLVAAVVGSYYAATQSHSFGVTEGISQTTAFVGGILLVFGARLASGCTSGHGLSGMGLLILPSIGGAASMFGCAILSALVLRL